MRIAFRINLGFGAETKRIVLDTPRPISQDIGCLLSSTLFKGKKKKATLILVAAEIGTCCMSKSIKSPEIPNS